jgi:PIN domain nuclease of toxin-antitoxin system
MTAALLLDTHTLVWWAIGSPQLPPETVQLIGESKDVRVSLVSLWEIVLKESTRHPMIGTDDSLGWFNEALASTPFELLAISAQHLGGVQSLPDRHRDPFDRLLVAQAIHEGLSLVSRDATLSEYPVEVLWKTDPEGPPMQPV